MPQGPVGPGTEPRAHPVPPATSHTRGSRPDGRSGIRDGLTGRLARTAGFLGVAVFVLAGCQSHEAEEDPGSAAEPMVLYEVWAADQNLDMIYVLDPDGEVIRVLDGEDLGGAERPHMLWGVPGDAYVYSANTVSESVTILGREDGGVKGVLHDVGKAPHAAQPNPVHPDRIYIFNIGPQEKDEGGTPDRGETLVEAIRSVGSTNGEVGWEMGRSMDLKASSALANDDLFPSRRPVCGGFSQDGSALLVTFFDGGLGVVDLERWEITRAWGKEEIARHGCGFAASPDGGEMYVTAGDMHASWLYVFDVSGPEPELVASHDLSPVGQDAHGVAVDPVREDLWVVHRVSDNVTIHPLSEIREEGHDFHVVEDVGAAPDLIAFSPGVDRAFLTLRGPNPAPTIPHATVGETPGVSILDVAGRRVLGTVPLGDQERADFHGLFIPAAHEGMGSP